MYDNLKQNKIHIYIKIKKKNAFLLFKLQIFQNYNV